MKILNNVVPMDNQTFPFVSCFASWLIAMGKSSLDMDKLKKKHQNLYRLYMPVTGSGLSALWNEVEPTLDLCYATKDQYLNWAMEFAGYSYEKIENDGTNRQLFVETIKSAIDAGEPVMAQSLIGSTWCLITGYEEQNATMDILYGWHQREWGIVTNLADGHLDNGMFIKKNWYDSIKSIVVYKGKEKYKLSAKEIFSHFVSVMETEKTGESFIGQAAFQKCMDTLSDASLYINLEDDKLQRMYKSVFFYCANFAEARVFTGSTIETSEFKKKINASNEEMGLLNMASAPCRRTHKLVWELWAVLGKDYNFEPELYANRLKDESVRREIMRLISKIYENDKEALGYFKKGLT